MSAGALLARLATALEDTAIPYMVVGSFASTHHGVPRTTHDLDVVIDATAASLDQLLAMLSPEQYYVDADVAREALRTRGMFNVIDLATGWKVDLIVCKARPFSREELARRQRATVLGVESYVASAEDVILSKLEWAHESGSGMQLRDVGGLVAVRKNALDLAYIDRWAAELGVEEAWKAIRDDSGGS